MRDVLYAAAIMKWTTLKMFQQDVSMLMVIYRSTFYTHVQDAMKVESQIGGGTGEIRDATRVYRAGQDMPNAVSPKSLMQGS